MRHILVFVCALHFAFTYSQWTSIPTGVGGRIESIDFIGDVGLFAQMGAMGRTTDGGDTWTTVVTGIAFRDVDMASATVAYAAGVSSEAMWISTDGGLEWDELTPFNSNSLWGVSAPSPGRAYFSGTGNAIWRTDLFGADLTVINPTGESTTITDIHFVSDDTGFALGETGKIYRTTNAGASWDLTFQGFGILLTALHFPSPQVGYVVGSDGRVVRTTDGGENWEEIQATADNVYLRSVHFADDMHGMIVGFSGVAAYTADGGTNWTTLSVPTTEHLYATYMQGPNSAIVAGEGGVMFRNAALATGLQELPVRSDLTVWPVPAADEVIIASPIGLTEMASITLFDQSGRPVLLAHTAFHDDRMRVDLAGLPDGPYQLQMASRSGRHYHARIVKLAR